MRIMGTPTRTILANMERCTNPVTKSVYRDIIGNRIDTLERHRLIHAEKIKVINKKLDI